MQGVKKLKGGGVPPVDIEKAPLRLSNRRTGELYIFWQAQAAARGYSVQNKLKNAMRALVLTVGPLLATTATAAGDHTGRGRVYKTKTYVAHHALRTPTAPRTTTSA